MRRHVIGLLVVALVCPLRAEPVRGAMAAKPAFVFVEPPVPVITEVVPPSVASGTLSALHLVGENFETGAVVRVDPPVVSIEAVRVISPTLAEITVLVRSDAPAGIVRMDLTNPSGGTTKQGGTLTVLPSDSLAAPLAVTSVAIVSPRPGTQIAEGEALYPQGVLAVTGSGSVIGSWLLDGVVFDRFVVHATAGQSASVTSHVPIPESFRGSHTLELAVDHPQRIVTPAVPIIQTAQRASQLTILAPADGFVIGQTPPELRWSLVPGASGYEIEVERPQPDLPLLHRTADAQWQLDPSDLATLGSGSLRWRVRPVFPGEVRGEPTEWWRLTVLPDRVELTLSPPQRDEETGRLALQWSGGSPGMIYLVEVLSVEESGVLFSGLTHKESYLFPPGEPRAPGPYRMRVTAYGPDGEKLGTSNSVSIANDRPEAFPPR